jgi:hypothetical protein
MRLIAPSFQLPASSFQLSQPLWPAWHARHELARCSESLRLLPGEPPEKPADVWPSFLFLFRAAHGDLRVSEVRSVSDMLGYAGGRIAPTGHGGAPERLPIVESIGGDSGPSIFLYVSLPDEEAAAAVASRCVMVRGVYEVWADLECDEADSGDQSWQRLASIVAEAPEAQKIRMLAPLGDSSWRVDVHSFGRKKPYSLARKRQLMDHLEHMLWRIPGDVDLADSSQRVTLLEDYRRGKVPNPSPSPSPNPSPSPSPNPSPSRSPSPNPNPNPPPHPHPSPSPNPSPNPNPNRNPNPNPNQAEGPADAAGPCRLWLGRRVSAGAGRLLHTYGLPRRHHLSRTSLPADLAFLMANQAPTLTPNP